MRAVRTSTRTRSRRRSHGSAEAVRGSRYFTVVAAAAAVAGLLVASGWLAPGRHRAAAAPPSCPILQVESQNGRSSDIVRLTLPSGARHLLHTSPYRLNAIAYSAAQDVTYGVADGWFRDGSHAVRIDDDGELTDLGPVGRDGHHGVWSWVTGATAGAMAGNSWYLLRDTSLYTVDVDPRSPRYLTATRQLLLHPWLFAAGIDDFAYNPADGLLYGVSSTVDGAVVTVDPVHGRVSIVPGQRFPSPATYGSVVFGPDRKLYATANRIGGRSVTYRMDGGTPVEVSTGPALVASDGAGCLASPAPPPPPPPPTSPKPPPPTSPKPPPPSSSAPSPSPTPSPAPSPSLSPGPSSAPSPAPPENPAPPALAAPDPELPSPVVPPPAEPARSAPPSQPHRPSAAPAKPFRKPPVPSQRAKRSHAKVQKQRRWGITAVLLIVGGGAVAGRARRAR